MAFHSCQAIQVLSHGFSALRLLHFALSPQPHAHVQAIVFRLILPDSYQGLCQKTFTTNTIFLLVRGIYNSMNLGSLKRVTPFRLSPCYGASSLSIAHEAQ